jgi:hypothetical protein
VERHRAELAPAIDVEARSRSIGELEQLRRRASEFIRELPEITSPKSVIEDRENAVVFDVVAKPEPAARCAAALRARFGDCVRIRVIAEKPTVEAPALFHHYSVDVSGYVLTVYWNSGARTPLPLQITEADDHVAVRVVERFRVGPMVLYARGRRASARLRGPLGKRKVIDATTGKARPARNPQRRRRPGSTRAHPRSTSGAASGRRNECRFDTQRTSAKCHAAVIASSSRRST